MLAPICLFTYNRLKETQQTVEALKKNLLASESELYIFSDGPKNSSSNEKVKSIRNYLKTINGFKNVTVIESKDNKGLAKSIISGVSQIINEFGVVIVLEDDLITSSNFLSYMNQCLNFYENEKKVLSISGHSFLNCIPEDYDYDSAFGLRASSWGWATWKDRWVKIDWEVSTYKKFKYNLIERCRFNRGGSDLSHMLDKQMAGKINSWAVRFCYHQFLNNMVDVFPKISKVDNIGFGEDGENCDFKTFIDKIDVSNKASFNLPEVVSLNNRILKNFRKDFSYKVRFRRVFLRLKESFTTK